MLFSSKILFAKAWAFFVQIKTSFKNYIGIGCAAGTHGSGTQRSGEHRRAGPGNLIKLQLSLSRKDDDHD
jgi:hypothetical protein